MAPFTRRPWYAALVLITTLPALAAPPQKAPPEPPPAESAPDDPRSEIQNSKSDAGPLGFDRKSPRKPEVRRPDWGKVIGWVLEAGTRQPVAGARVAVEIDGGFPEKGKATDLTEKDGSFAAKAPLGNISSKFDWGRLLTMHPISLLLSPTSITKKTKMLEVTQVNVRVEADGYKPFVGKVRATRLDAGGFSITLDDVWLAKEGSNLASFTPERLRLEIIEDLKVEPRVAAPGESVDITLTARLPVERGHRYKAFATSTASRLVKDPTELKLLKERGKDGQLVFTRTVKLPKHPVDRWTELSFVLVRDGVTELRQRDVKTLLQIAQKKEEREAAEKVADGYLKARIGDQEGALRLYAAARTISPDYTLAQLLYGDQCIRLNRPKEAVDAYRRLVESEPSDYQTARPRYALALLDSGSQSEAMRTLAGAEETLGKKKVPAEVALLRARIFASQGNFVEADRWIAKAGAEVEIPQDIQNEINVKRIVAAVKAKPDNPDLRQSYARVLTGMRRREEAISQLRQAVKLDPAQPWAFIDLGVGLHQVGRREEGMENLRHALKLSPDNTEAQLALADAYRELGQYPEALPLYRKVVESQRMNLKARHYYALMLYATGDLDRARVELFEVISQARDKGDLREDGLIIPGAAIYLGPKRRLVYGFSIPEAAADMAIVEALQDLKKHPESGLLWQNIGSALLDLDLPHAALPALERARKAEPGLLETEFLLGLAYRRLGEGEKARAALKNVVTANPLHPRARLELAQLYTDEGELELAQAEILAHSKNYPYERASRPAQSFGG